MNPHSEIIVIGASKGGLKALRTVLSVLPRDYPIPVAVAFHRRKNSGAGLGEHFAKFLLLPVREVEDKDAVLPGAIYLAPADYHLLVENGHFALSIDAPVNHARPSIDVLFESAAESFGRGVIGVILTGDGHDGAKGLAAVKRCGGTTVVQDPDTAENRGMPEAAIAAGPVDFILPLEAVGPFLIKIRN